MPADGRGAWRSPRSSPSWGKPSTWRRRTAGLRHEKPFRRSGVKSPAPLDAKVAQERVLGWQTKLSRWAVQDEQARFGDLFNLVCDPATLLVAWERVKRNRGVADRRCRWPDPRAGRADRRGACPRRAPQGAQGWHLPSAAGPRAADPQALGELRSLGISTVRDRIVQTATKLVLEPMFEAGFCPTSYGFSARATSAGRHRRGAVLHQRRAKV
jgi:hypothetical protein